MSLITLTAKRQARLTIDEPVGHQHERKTSHILVGPSRLPHRWDLEGWLSVGRRLAEFILRAWGSHLWGAT